MKGLFITFEGLDGVGKTTQIDLLRRDLENQSKEIVLTREPGGTKLGETLRGIILDGSAISPEAETLLFAAARAELVSEVIIPALERDAIVLCDRFIDSSFAYQGFARGLTVESVADANRLALRGIMPDITFYLRLNPDEGTKRMAGKNLDRMERESPAFHERVKHGFEEVVALYPGRIKSINAERLPEEIAKEISLSVKEWIKLNWKQQKICRNEML